MTRGCAHTEHCKPARLTAVCTTTLQSTRRAGQQQLAAAHAAGGYGPTSMLTRAGYRPCRPPSRAVLPARTGAHACRGRKHHVTAPASRMGRPGGHVQAHAPLRHSVTRAGLFASLSSTSRSVAPLARAADDSRHRCRAAGRRAAHLQGRDSAGAAPTALRPPGPPRSRPGCAVAGPAPPPAPATSVGLPGGGGGSSLKL